MSTQNVVGYGNYGTNTPKPTPTPTPSPTINVSNLEKQIAEQVAKTIGQSIQAGTAGAIAPSATLNLLESLSNAQLAALATVLKKMGYSVKANIGSIKGLFQTEPELEALANNVVTKNGTGSTLISDLNMSYIPIGSTEGPTLPTRTITQQDPVVLGKIVDSVYQKGLGRNASEKERNAAIADAQKLIEEGTLTTTAKVKNPKTGQMENVTTVKSAFSQSSFEENLSEKLKELNPDDYDRNKRIEFNTWLNGVFSGGQA